jgi:hypothetical protein
MKCGPFSSLYIVFDKFLHAMHILREIHLGHPIISSLNIANLNENPIGYTIFRKILQY